MASRPPICIPASRFLYNRRVTVPPERANRLPLWQHQIYYNIIDLQSLVVNLVDYVVVMAEMAKSTEFQRIIMEGNVRNNIATPNPVVRYYYILAI